MADSFPSSSLEPQKRRSSRIVQAVPLTVLGVDALGRPFQERTSTTIVNCHGCRYQSKHYVLKNMWVTLEVPHPEPGQGPRTVRARVMWIQRPRTVRELFQVGVELEMGGNLWGIAFPPPDWFSFPEDLPAPPAIPASSMSGGMPGGTHVSLSDGTSGPISGADFGVVPDQPASEGEETQNWPAEANADPGTEDNLRTIPLSGVSDPSLMLARQMMHIVNEAKQQLESTARESAVHAVTAEAGPLIAALHNQIEEAARQSVASATEQSLANAERALASATERALANVAERATHGVVEQTIASETQLRQLRENWGSTLAASIDQASQTVSTRIAEMEQERRSAFLQELEAETQRTVENLRRVTQEFEVRLAQAQGGVDQFARQAQEAAAPAILEIEQRMRAHAEEARGQFNEFERAARQWNELLTSSASAAQLNWQARLESDVDAAGSRWKERIESSVDFAAQQAADRLAQRSQEVADRIARETDSRMVTLGQALVDTSAEVEQKMASLRETLDQQTARTQDVLAQAQAAAHVAEEKYQQLEALDQTALQEMERRSSSLLEAHTQELDRRADTTLAAWTERLQPAMQEAGDQTVARLGAQLETEFGSHLERANQALGNLDSGTQTLNGTVHEALRRHDEELGKISEQSIQAAIARMQGAIDQLEHSLEESGRGATAKWIAEIETKATETTHTTFESLFKTAEWYEKKVQAQMQTSLEKGMEQTSEMLRKRAGEISGMFAAELDHYSRSYVEHTQDQIEETGRTVIEGVRKQSVDAAASSATAIQQQAHNQTEAALSQFRNKIGVTLTQSSSQLEALAAQARSKFENDAQRTQTEFRASLAHEAQSTVSKSRQQLIGQAETAKEDLRAEGKQQEIQLRQTLGQLGDLFIESYKKRLENASNSWLLTTVSRLNEQSAQQLDELTRLADARLRQKCGQVFASVGETLRKRLTDVVAAPILNKASASDASENYTNNPTNNDTREHTREHSGEGAAETPSSRDAQP